MDPIIDLTSDEHFMREALRQARRAEATDEVPVGAVVAHEGRIIARAHNQVETLKDATAHAEILAITQASQALGDWRLEGCTLYVTKEPCAMCAGAIVLARLTRLVFGAIDPKAGGAGSRFNIVAHPSLNHRVETKPGVLEEDCAALLKRFFAAKR
jgi:tRNA(adenine34) deaminase